MDRHEHYFYIWHHDSCDHKEKCPKFHWSWLSNLFKLFAMVQLGPADHVRSRGWPWVIDGTKISVGRYGPPKEWECCVVGVSPYLLQCWWWWGEEFDCNERDPKPFYSLSGMTKNALTWCKVWDDKWLKWGLRVSLDLFIDYSLGIQQFILAMKIHTCRFKILSYR